jgi:hypothetical protein
LVSFNKNIFSNPEERLTLEKDLENHITFLFTFSPLPPIGLCFYYRKMHCSNRAFRATVLVCNGKTCFLLSFIIIDGTTDKVYKF